MIFCEVLPLGGVIGILIALVVVFILFFTVIVLRYKKCPADKILVIYGKVGKDKNGNDISSKCIHGGAVFIWPFIQAYTFLDLTPLSIHIDLKQALTSKNEKTDIVSRFTVGISTEPDVMQNAAERLLGLSNQNIIELATDIIMGQMRLTVGQTDIETINAGRDKFLETLCVNVEEQIKKVGLRLINVNILSAD